MLTLTSLAASAGRKGARHDFGDPFPRRVAVSVKVVPGTAPTEFSTFGVWLMTSHDDSNKEALYR